MTKKKFDPFDYPSGAVPKYYHLNNVVLFFDVVGFSRKAPIDMQNIINEIDNVINELLWNEYNWNERHQRNDLIIIPTGDGYGIGFHPNFDGKKILTITANIYKKLIENRRYEIRMGLAKGRNTRYWDINDLANLFGPGINTANRVISVALQNQILVHADFAKEILKNEKIKELVEVPYPLQIKTGEEIRVYNYFRKDDFGNPIMPKRMQLFLEIFSKM